MFKNIKYFYHKKGILLLVYIYILVLYIFFILLCMRYECRDILSEKIFVSSFILISLFLLHKLKRVKTFFVILTVIVEFDAFFTIFYYPSLYFIILIPFSMIFCFFYFLKIKEALIASLIHYLYWIAIFGWEIFTYNNSHFVFNYFSQIILFLSSLPILLFSIFFYYSNEYFYQKISEKNRENILILNEIHHRIKNNLNMISSILGLQILSLENKKESSAQIKDILQNSKLRIETVAIIHDTLYKENHIKRIKFQEYIERLSDLVEKTYNKNVSIKIDADEIFLSFETMFRIGLILNELLTNSLKYAFKENQKSQIFINLQRNSDSYTLIYWEKENRNIDVSKILNSKTLGIKLVKLLIKQMEALMRVCDENGLKFVIKFKNNPSS